jgi:hypothetical protein
MRWLSMRPGPRLFMGSGPLIAAGAGALIRLKPGFQYWYGLLPPLSSSPSACR